MAGCWSYLSLAGDVTHIMRHVNHAVFRTYLEESRDMFYA